MGPLEELLLCVSPSKAAKLLILELKRNIPFELRHPCTGQISGKRYLCATFFTAVTGQRSTEITRCVPFKGYPPRFFNDAKFKFQIPVSVRNTVPFLGNNTVPDKDVSIVKSAPF